MREGGREERGRIVVSGGGKGESERAEGIRERGNGEGELGRGEEVRE